MRGRVDLSLLVCSKNRPDQLRRLAQRLLRLAREAGDRTIELVVVEDVSGVTESDRPAPVDGALYVTIDEPGTGFGGIRQRAVDRSNGDLIVFIDDDCVPCEEWLEHLTAPFAEEGASATGGGILPQDGNVVSRAISLLGFPAGGLPRLLRAGTRPIPSSLLSTGNLALRREAVATAGGFDRRHRFGGEDQELVKRLGGTCLFVPTALVLHRNRERLRDVWSWFFRRGAGEYHVNRHAGLERVHSVLHPIQWSWYWRAGVFAALGLWLGWRGFFALCGAYVGQLFLRTLYANRGHSPIPAVEERLRYCLRPLPLLLCPFLRMWMDLGREAGRLHAAMTDGSGKQKGREGAR